MHPCERRRRQLLVAVDPLRVVGREHVRLDRRAPGRCVANLSGRCTPPPPAAGSTSSRAAPSSRPIVETANARRHRRPPAAQRTNSIGSDDEQEARVDRGQLVEAVEQPRSRPMEIARTAATTRSDATTPKSAERHEHDEDRGCQSSDCVQASRAYAKRERVSGKHRRLELRIPLRVVQKRRRAANASPPSAAASARPRSRVINSSATTARRSGRSTARTRTASPRSAPPTAHSPCHSTRKTTDERRRARERSRSARYRATGRDRSATCRSSRRSGR